MIHPAEFIRALYPAFAIPADVGPAVAEPPFDAGEKLRWLESIASDPRTRGLDVRIAIGITNRVGKHEGRAPIAQTWLATFIGASARGVREAADHLCELGHLRIDRTEAIAASNRKAFGGRGKANIYDPVLPPKPTRKPGAPVPGLVAETWKIPARNPANSRTKPRTAVPPLPKESHKTSLRAVEDSKADDPLDPSQLSWTAVKRRLARRLNPEEIKSWIDALWLKRLSEHEAVLVARTPFHCSHIENGYLGDRILDAWRAEQPSIARVLFVTAQI